MQVSSLRPLAVAAALFVVVTVERFLLQNPLDAAGFLYVVPISVVAAEYGIRAGLLSAWVATALTLVWAHHQHVDLPAVAIANEALAFGGVGALVGWQCVRRARVERHRERLLAELEAMALRDGLTGLPNRRAWDLRLEEELARASRSDRPLAVVAADLDGLKRVNDTHGHERGDDMLRACADAWRRTVRGPDFVARLGGDEFFAVLPETGPDAAMTVTARLIDALPEPYRCSLGVAVWDRSETAQELMRRADEALYVAKRSGGGRATVAGAPQEPARWTADAGRPLGVL